MSRPPSSWPRPAGPGFTNALSGIANARLSNAPVVLLAGCVGLESVEKLDLQDMNQLPVIEPMVKKAWVCSMAERIPEFIDLAFRTAAAGRPGPVYLELPCDVLNAAVDPARVKRFRSRVDSRPTDSEGAQEILTMLQAAHSPVIIAGSGVWYADAGEALREFAERTGIPVFTGNSGRGTISDTHPLCFQSSLAIRPGSAFFALASADLILFLGSRLSLFYLFGDIFRKDAKFIQADIEAEEIGRNRSVDLGIVGDVRALLSELNRLVGAQGSGGTLSARFQGWVETLRKADVDGPGD
jgi:acetolactate synthase-1/2/3 large subunit